MDIKLRIAYFIFAMVGTVIIAFITLASVGIGTVYSDVTYAATDLKLVYAVPFEAYPWRYFLALVGGGTAFVMMAMVVDLMTSHLIPAEYWLSRYIAQQVARINLICAVLVPLPWAYQAMFSDNIQHVEQMRRWTVVLYPAHQGTAALAVMIVGGVLFYSQRIFPRWVSSMLSIGGACSVVLCVLSVDPTLPITRFGFLYLPYVTALVIMAVFIVIATKQAETTTIESVKATIYLAR
jgi:hypothetical protein